MMQCDEDNVDVYLAEDVVEVLVLVDEDVQVLVDLEVVDVVLV
jgi:hypothetical protein